MAELLDTLDLSDRARLEIVIAGDRFAAVPTTRGTDGRWMRARPGDGASEALLDLLARGAARYGRFTVRSWAPRSAVGEREVGVDQTNESVIVGDVAVVKWASHLEMGPHPAPRRIGVLREAGFTGMPAPWGLITWDSPAGAETLVASVDEYLPGAVDGWTWAVDLVTAAARHRRVAPLVAAAAEVGALIADLHAALSGTVTVATPAAAARWRGDARRTLELACASGDSDSITLARSCHDSIDAALDVLGTLAGTAVLDGHGDLHVGQILRSGGRFVVTDFDGNPVLPAEQRMLPIPAVLDVAGMTQSWAHVSIVARKYTDLDPVALAAADTAARTAFLDAYAARLVTLGHVDLYDPSPLRAFRLQQVLREIIYATRHLPRWMYVPDAALPALLDERTVREA
ncbi:MAG: glucosamine kinase [Mycobacterium sp.]